MKRATKTLPKSEMRHYRMVSLVDQMLALHKQLPQARTPQEQTGLQRLIEATDRLESTPWSTSCTD